MLALRHRGSRGSALGAKARDRPSALLRSVDMESKEHRLKFD